MTTQYTPILKLALPVTGELSGTWGDVVNDNITSMVEQAIAGLATISTWSANAHTLSTANGTTSESRCAMLVAQDGAGLSASGEIVCPASSKLYVLKNATSYQITLKTASGTGVAVASGNTAFLFCDGTNVNACVTTIVDGRVTGNLTVDGNATINGNTALGNATSDTITATARFASGLIPSADNTYDLGSTANSWKDLYIDGTATMALVAISGGTINGVSIGATTPATFIAVDNLSLDGNTIASTNTNGNIVIAPNGTGDVQLDADTVRVGDSGAAATLTSNGAGALTVTTGGAADLTLSTNSGTTSGTITIANGANGNITLTPNGTGDVILSADTTQIGDANTDAYLTTNGTGSLNLTTNNGTNSGTIQIAQGANGNITLTPNGTGLVSVPSVTLSGGTANGVAYLNGSKVLTTGSALTFAGNVLAAPNMSISGVGNYLYFDTTGGGNSNFIQTVNDYDMRLYCGRGSTSYIDVGTNGQVFGIGGSEQMRLTSTGLGIGNSSPTAKLDVTGTAAISGAVTLSGGTANGVAYLNGSKVVTTGSALTFDGTKLGVGTASPLAGSLVTLGDGTSSAVQYLNAGATGGSIVGRISGSNTWIVGDTANVLGSGVGLINYVYGNNPTIWYNNSSEQMRLTSTGLGIGTSSPAAKLEVAGGASSITSLFKSSSGTATTLILQQTGVRQWSVYLPASSNNFVIRDDSAAQDRLILDSSGNLGLGVTPSAWNSNFKTLEFAGNVSVGSFGTASPNLWIMANAYYNGAGNWIYSQSNYATQYNQTGGQHAWFTAPSGTAGNAITFTQAMTLDASGYLGVGKTSPNVRLDVLAAAAGNISRFSTAGTSGYIEFSNSGGTTGFVGSSSGINNGGGNNALGIRSENEMTFGTGGGNERARITSDGNLLVGTTTNAGFSTATVSGTGSDTAPFSVWNKATSGNNYFTGWWTEGTATLRGSINFNRGSGVTSYNTTSDYRAKDIIGPVTDSGTLIDSVPVYMGKMKGATQERPMFIAHETPSYAHTGEKDAVDADGNPVYQQMDASTLVPVMWAEIQSLRARVAQLESN